MKKSLLLSVSCLLLITPFLTAWCLGYDHRHLVPKGEGGWPGEFIELFKREDRVHGYFLNRIDVFFYAGDTKAFNDFLKQCSKLKDASVELVLRAGRKKARSPWDKNDRDIDVDWRLHAERLSSRNRGGRDVRYAMRVDLWIGRSVQLEKLEVPVAVGVKSGSEIDTFVAEHEKKRAQNADIRE